MKSRDTSFFELFQDPLFTMMAIVLMGTVWIIVPEQSTPADQKTLMVKDEVGSLRRTIEVKEAAIERLKNERSNFSQKFSAIKEIVDDRAIDIMKLKTEVALLEKDIDSMRREKNELDETLKKAKDLSALMENINKLEKEIERKREELSRSNERLRTVKQETTHTKELNELFAKLQAELKALLDEIARIEPETKDNRGMGGKFKPVFESDKRPIYIELVADRLFPIDDDHYDAKSHLRMSAGRTVTVLSVTRKSTVQGESVDRIQNPESIFQNVLKKGSTDNQRVVFLVHGDSFEILRAARNIALNKNYEISWWPNEDKELTFTTGVGKDDIPSTGGPAKR